MVRKLDVLRKEDIAIEGKPVGKEGKNNKSQSTTDNNIQPSTLNIQPPVSGHAPADGRIDERKCFRCGQRKILNGVCQNCGERYDN
jgi:hypothetical protein